MSIHTSEQPKISFPSATRKPSISVLDLLLLLCIAVLLYYGAFWRGLKMQGAAALQFDTSKYQCYAMAFWHGTDALRSLPKEQCLFITHPAANNNPLTTQDLLKQLEAYHFPQAAIHFITTQQQSQPFHALPKEYPLLDIIPFSLPLLFPTIWYQYAFAAMMVLIMGLIYFTLKHRASPTTAYAFAIYAVLSGWATAEGRFDLLPAALTLFALLCAERRYWSWAFVWLGLATMMKFYPVLLFPLFFITQQKQSHEHWLNWRRYLATGIYTAICLLIFLCSLLLSVEGTIGPLRYFTGRPIQIESTSASMLWIHSQITGSPLMYLYSFGSRNVLSAIASPVALLASVLLLSGFLFLCWQIWRDHITLSLAVLLALLFLMVTGKVFSAQYLLWVAPFVAYVGRWNWRWLVSWSSISLVTLLIYPYIYERNRLPFGALLPDLSATICLRNLLLLGLTCALFYLLIRRSRRHNFQAVI